MIAQRRSLRFGFVPAWHVTKSPGFDKRRNDGATQRAGAAGDGYMPIAKIHDANPSRNCWMQKVRAAAESVAHNGGKRNAPTS
jgi:hypothetical protein